MTDAPAVYLTDHQIARRLGLAQSRWADIAHKLSRQGLPAADPLFDDRRYWPAVVAFLDRRNGVGTPSLSLVPDGEENFVHGR